MKLFSALIAVIIKQLFRGGLCYSWINEEQKYFFTVCHKDSHRIFPKTNRINDSGKMRASIFVLPWTSRTVGYLIFIELGKGQNQRQSGSQLLHFFAEARPWMLTSKDLPSWTRSSSQSHDPCWLLAPCFHFTTEGNSLQLAEIHLTQNSKAYIDNSVLSSCSDTPALKMIFFSRSEYGGQVTCPMSPS